MPKPSLKSVPKDLSGTAKAYFTIYRQIKALEAELKPYKAILEEAATESNNVIELDSYRVAVSPCSREVFDLKVARKELGDKVLSPFIRLSHFNRLTVAEKKKAA